MSNEEANSVYKCTVHEYHVSNKWDTGDTPSQTMELQEMDIGFQKPGICADSWFLESNGKMVQLGFSLIIFFMKYPMSFLHKCCKKDIGYFIKNMFPCIHVRSCLVDHDREGRGPILVMKIKVQVTFNHLLSDLRLPIEICHVERVWNTRLADGVW